MTADILARSPEQLAPQLLGSLSETLRPEIASLRQAPRNWRGHTWRCPLRVKDMKIGGYSANLRCDFGGFLPAASVIVNDPALLH
jgi:hypothetical protein